MRVEGAALSGVLRSARPHSHDNWEIILNVRGAGVETVGDRTAPFYPGSIALCPPGVEHGKSCGEEEAPWQDIYFQFRDETGWFHPRATWLEDDCEHSAEKLLRVLLGLRGRREEHTLAAADALGEAICRLLWSWDAAGRADRLTERLKSEMIFRFTDPEFTAADAMEPMNYSPDYARRVFRQDTGETPTAYLTRLRLNHARELLLRDTRPAYTIREIAFLSGFYDSDYFCRVFSRETGLSPTRFRAAGRFGK